MRLGLKFLFLACFAWAFTGCGGDGDGEGGDGGHANVVIETLRFGEQLYEVGVDASFTPDLFVKVKGGTEEKYDFVANPYGITLTADNKALVNIDDKGVVTGIEKGATTLKARAPRFVGYAWTNIKVLPPIMIAKLRFDKDVYMTENTTFTPTIYCQMENENEESVYDLEKNRAHLEFSVDNEDVATVSENGVVTSKAPGTVVLTVSSKLYTKTISAKISFFDKTKLHIGEWKLLKWNSEDESALKGKVFLALNESLKFELYQSLNTETGFKKFDGTYKIAKEGGKQILSGTYTDGAAWSDSYEMTVTAAELTLKAKKTGTVSVYVRELIPDYAKAVSVTRAEVVPFL